jgi:hypothetical protein
MLRTASHLVVGLGFVCAAAADPGELETDEQLAPTPTVIKTMPDGWDVLDADGSGPCRSQVTVPPSTQVLAVRVYSSVDYSSPSPMGMGNRMTSFCESTLQLAAGERVTIEVSEDGRVIPSTFVEAQAARREAGWTIVTRHRDREPPAPKPEKDSLGGLRLSDPSWWFTAKTRRAWAIEIYRSGVASCVGEVKKAARTALVRRICASAQRP